MYYFIYILYLISAVTSLPLKIDNDIEHNNTRRSEKQDPSKWYPIQSYRREATAFYDKEDVSDSDSNSNKALKTPTRTPQRKQKREEGRFSTTQNTKYIKERTTHNKIKDQNGRKHHRQKHINRQSNLPHTQALKTLRKSVQNEKGYNNQINPDINNSFKKSDTKTHNSSHFKQYYRTYIRNRLWPEIINVTVFSTPFIRNIKAMKSTVNNNTDNIENVSHEVQRIWQQELQQQIKNKTEEEFNKKINEDVEKQLSHNLKKTPADFVNIINRTISLWQPWVHKVKDDVKINSFLNRTLHHNLGLFLTVEQKTKDKRWKKILKELAATYEKKFKEFIKDSKHHKVKSRMGTERVIINCIEVSNRIIKRLLNYELDDMDKKGFLRNSRTVNIIAKELQENTKSELKRTCLKLGICRSHNGFTEFVIDFLTMTLSLDVHKFEKAYSTVISAVKSTNFSQTLGHNSDKALKKYVTEFEHVDLLYKKSAIMIIKNIIMKRNSPLIIYGDSNIGQVNKTIALLEIINILDKDVPNNDENRKEWINIKTNLDNFAKDRDSNIQSTMLAFVTHIKNVIDRLNAKSRIQITHNSEIILT